MKLKKEKKEEKTPAIDDNPGKAPMPPPPPPEMDQNKETYESNAYQDWLESSSAKRDVTFLETLQELITEQKKTNELLEKILEQ